MGQTTERGSQVGHEGDPKMIKQQGQDSQSSWGGQEL